MKRFLLLLILSFSMNIVFAQLEVSEGSFKEVAGFVNINLEKQTDDNFRPYAVIKVKTDNINAKERQRLRIDSDAGSSYEIEYLDGEMWIYISYYVTYLEINHPEMGLVYFKLPFDMEPKKGYELTLVNNTSAEYAGDGALSVTTIPEGAEIFINGRDIKNTAPYVNDMIPAGKYEITVTKDRYYSVTQTIDVKANDTTKVKIEMQLAVAEITLESDYYDTNIYIDGVLVGTGVWDGELYGGKYEVEYKRKYCGDVRQTIIVEPTSPKTYKMEPTQNYGVVTIVGPAKAKVYIDGEERGVTPLTVKDLALGKHSLRLVKNKYKYTTVFTLEDKNELIIQGVKDKNREVTITTDTPGDKIFINEAYFGETPLTISLSYGHYDVIAVRGAKKEMNTLMSITNGEKSYKKIKVTKEGATSFCLEYAPEGAVKGAFKDLGYIAKGNLQYNAATNTWRFAEHQWDCIGETYDGWTDLFTWRKECWDKSCNIINGKGPEWRTPKTMTWVYFMDRNPKISAQVAGVNGIIVLPMGWISDYYYLKDSDDFMSNIIPEKVWLTIFEPNGAAFLPAAGVRNDNNIVEYSGEGCCYWTSTLTCKMSDTIPRKEIEGSHRPSALCLCNNAYLDFKREEFSAVNSVRLVISKDF